MKALITGASSGIGLMYAKQLASMGYDLVIVSNQEQELSNTAKMLEKTYGMKAYVKFSDLTAPQACESLHSWCKNCNHEIDVLINNAGVFFFNDIKNTTPSRVQLMLDLHVKTTTSLCQLFSSDMIERGHGHILNMSSMSAWICYPGISTYCATKAYILSFSKSLWYELKPYGVSVTAVCPGAVDTGLYGLSDYWRKIAVNIGVSMPPEKLVRKALVRMFKGKKEYLPGPINHIFLPFLKHIPDWVIFRSKKLISKFQK